MFKQCFFAALTASCITAGAQGYLRGNQSLPAATVTITPQNNDWGEVPYGHRAPTYRYSWCFPEETSGDPAFDFNWSVANCHAT